MQVQSTCELWNVLSLTHPTKAPILIGWSGHRRPKAAQLFCRGIWSNMSGNSWQMIFNVFQPNLLIYSSQCSTNWHFPLESLQGWDIGFKSSTRFMLSPSPMAAGTSYRKSTKKTIIAKGTKVPRVLPKKVHNNHPTTRSRFKALTKQIRSAAQLWQCCFQTVDELSAVAQLSQMISTTPTSTSANNQQLLSGHLYQPESHQSNLLNSSL